METLKATHLQIDSYLDSRDRARSSRSSNPSGVPNSGGPSREFNVDQAFYSSGPSPGISRESFIQGQGQTRGYQGPPEKFIPGFIDPRSRMNQQQGQITNGSAAGGRWQPSDPLKIDKNE